MEAGDGCSEAFLEVRAAKLSVRDDRKADCFLSLYDVANSFILDGSELLPADFRILLSPEGSAKLQWRREAADLIDTHFFKVFGLRVSWHVQAPQVIGGNRLRLVMRQGLSEASVDCSLHAAR